MADKKITQLTELASVSSVDLLPIVDDPSGLPELKKVTVANLVTDRKLNLSDVTTNNASTTKHGFLPKLSGNNSQFLNGIGSFAVPTGLYYPITSTAIINNTGFAVGTYDYDVTSYGVPSGATGVIVRLVAKWSTVNLSAFSQVRRYGGDTLGGIAVWCKTANGMEEISGVIQLTSNKITFLVSGLSTASSWLILTGYFK